MFSRFIGAVKRVWAKVKVASHHVFKRLTQPASADIVTGILADLPRSRSELVTENAFLRQQLAMLHRQIKPPRLSWGERLSLLWLSRWVPHWKQVLQIVQPDTLLRGRREGFRCFWRMKSRAPAHQPKQMATETIALIKQLARWTTEQIRAATSYGEKPAYLICDNDGELGSALNRWCT